MTPAVSALILSRSLFRAARVLPPRQPARILTFPAPLPIPATTTPIRIEAGMSRRDALRARYARDLDRLIAKAERLDESTLRGLMTTLNDARREVADIVTRTDWSRAHFDLLRARIERTMKQLARSLGEDLGRYEDARWKNGATATDEILRRFGGEAEMLSVPLDAGRLTVHKEFSADLITYMSQEQIAKISQSLNMGLLSGRSASDVLKDMGTRIVNPDGSPAPGVWGDVATRAEAIYRTEANRVFSVAEQARMMQHERIRPGLRKRWIHSGKGPTGRPSHKRAERDYAPGGNPGPIPVAETFVLHVGADEATKRTPVGNYECMYPRDARLDAPLAVLCGCASSPYRMEWEEAA